MKRSNPKLALLIVFLLALAGGSDVRAGAPEDQTLTQKIEAEKADPAKDSFEWLRSKGMTYSDFLRLRETYKDFRDTLASAPMRPVGNSFAVNFNRLLEPFSNALNAQATRFIPFIKENDPGFGRMVGLRQDLLKAWSDFHLLDFKNYPEDRPRYQARIEKLAQEYPEMAAEIRKLSKPVNPKVPENFMMELEIYRVTHLIERSVSKFAGAYVNVSENVSKQVEALFSKANFVGRPEDKALTAKNEAEKTEGSERAAAMAEAERAPQNMRDTQLAKFEELVPKMSVEFKVMHDQIQREIELATWTEPAQKAVARSHGNPKALIVGAVALVTGAGAVLADHELNRSPAKTGEIRLDPKKSAEISTLAGTRGNLLYGELARANPAEYDSILDKYEVPASQHEQYKKIMSSTAAAN